MKSPFFIFSVIFVFILFFLPPIDTDLGWHLRYGNYFWDTGKILKENILTYYLPGYKWSNSYTLYQMTTSLLFKLGGFWSLSIIYSLIMGLSYIMFNLINPKLLKINFLAFLIICLFGWNVFNLGFRSQIFTFTLVIVLYLLILQVNKNPKILLFTPIIFPFWVNLHGGYFLGLIVLSFLFLQNLLQKDWNNAKYSGISLGTSTLMTFINPFGISVYAETLKHVNTPLGTLIAEWVSPNSSYKVAIIIVSTFVVYLLFTSRIKNRIFWILSILAFTYLAFTAKRNLPLLGLTWVLTIVDLYKKHFLMIEKNIYLNKLSYALLFGGIIFSLTVRGKTFEINSDWHKYCNQGLLPLPCKAVELIRGNKIEGENVFSSYEWGGFLEWQLPKYKFFVDGRTPAWETPEGISPYSVYLEIIQAQPSYQESLERYQTDWLLIGAGTFLDLELQKKQDRWKEIYRDDISVIYISS